VTYTRELLRELPSLDRLLNHARIKALCARFSRGYIAEEGRRVLDALREAIRQGQATPEQLDEASILSSLEQKIDAAQTSTLGRVVNATGTIVHTNLGRALLPEAAVDALRRVAADPVNLEYDLVRGERGRREEIVERLLCDLTGAEAGTVVNNNAAAVLLGLNTLANGKQVIVSRGELVEIGGSFRMPDVMVKSGAILREVGTTNRTHIEDYEKAIGDQTGLLLKVHTSNYAIVGFSSEVGLGELVTLGRKRGIPVMEDLGSGALVDLSQYGLPKEPVVGERIAMGADLVTFSGDKVLGGPQAGLVVGSRDCISRLAANPLHRALRCGKLTIAALEATLRLYRQSANLAADIPALRAFTRPIEDIEDMGERVRPALSDALGQGFQVSLEHGTSQIGSGALPTHEIPTRVLAVQRADMDAERIAERFRMARPPIIGRIKDGRFLLDLRTIFNPDDLIPRW
jgi:L-seryl-tRNA(Ser) seleniumtransferase